MTRIISVVSGKGGVGKTTLVSNLGTLLHLEFGKNVIVVDCNVTTSHLALALGLYETANTLNDVIKGTCSIVDSIYTLPFGLKVVPTSLSIDKLIDLQPSRVQDVMKELAEYADILLLDSAPCLGKEAMITLQASDEVLFVSTPFIPAIADIARINDLVNRMGKKSLGLVLNMVKNSKFELKESEIKTLTDLPILAILPYDDIVLKSLSMKVPAVLLNEHSPFSIGCKKVAFSLMGETFIPEKRGLWSIISDLRGILFRKFFR